MVKKIVALAISCALAIGSLISYNVINDEAVEFGAGKGVSRTIKNVSELSEVLAEIPTFDEYSANGSIADVEGKEGFKGITVIESGKKISYSNYRRGIRLPNADEDDENLYKSRVQELLNHRLEMSFGENAVYYHSIGTQWTATEYYEYEEPSGESSSYTYNFYNDEFEVAYRTKIDYDVEIYHSNDKSMFKINKYDTVTQRATRVEEYELKYVDYTPEEDEDDGDDFSQVLIDKMLKIRQDNYGVWIVYPQTEDGEGSEGGEETEPENPFAALEGLDPESKEYQDAYMQIMIDAMVQEFSAQLIAVAYQDLETVKAAHDSNQAYLSSLSGFIAEKAGDSKYFTKKGSTYNLKDAVYVPEVRDPDTNEVIEEGYTDYTAPDAYMEIVGVTPVRGDGNSSYTKMNFNVNSDFVSIYQEVNTSTNYNANEYKTNTCIMNIDNTIVNLSKNAKTKTLDEAYVQPFSKIMQELVTQMQSQQGGNE